MCATEPLLGDDVTWAPGYGVDEPAERPSMFGFVGVGGSIAHADTASGVSFALMRGKSAERLDAVIAAPGAR